MLCGNRVSAGVFANMNDAGAASLALLTGEDADSGVITAKNEPRSGPPARDSAATLSLLVLRCLRGAIGTRY